MNQKLIIGIIAIIIVAGVGILASNSSKTEMVRNDAAVQKVGSAMDQAKVTSGIVPSENNAMMKKDDSAMVAKSDMMIEVGSYESYDASKVAMASATHDVVLFFKASWCPACVALDKDIKANLSAIPKSLTILETNYDNSADLKRKYGVTLQHTLVQVDAGGNLIKKWSGSPTLASLVSEVK